VLVSSIVSPGGLVLLLAMLVAPSALAAPGAAARGALAAEPGPGLWMVEGEGDEPWLAPQVSTEVHVRVSGLIAHGRIEQVFDNPSEQAVEAVYVFPLESAAAVDGLSLQVGARTLSARLDERAPAAGTFERAAEAGRVAALLDRDRPDVLTTRVANIPAGATVTVTLRYRQLVGAAHGALTLDVPTTLIPRGVSGGAEADGLAQPARAMMPVAALASPPVALDGSGPLFDVWVELDRGVDPSSVRSASHAIDVSTRASSLAVQLHEGPVLADRDFVLRWSPQAGAATATVVGEAIGGDRYLLASVPSPLDSALGAAAESGRGEGGPATPRDVTIVVDTSSSMAGAALAEASAAVRAALARLTPLDRFNLIETASPPRSLFAAPRAASVHAVEQALAWTAALRATGDAVLAPALERVLVAGPPEAGRRERVVLISDGDVGDERQLARQIAARLAARRLFTLGVGPAQGRYALRGLARAGRGSFTAIADLGEVGARVAELDAELGAPALEALSLGTTASGRLEPELHAGQTLLVLARLAPGARVASVGGRRAGEPWQRQLALDGDTRVGRLDRLWAWRELEALEGMDARALADSAAIRLELARQGGLASALTSFVAVDPERSVEQRAPRSAVPLALPAGSEMFGELPELPPPGPTCSRQGLEPPLFAAAERAVSARAFVQCGLSG
jgi:Ca-activated chloride channel homolog